MFRLTRRQFSIGGAIATVAVIGCHSAESDWETLSNAQARTLAALCDQIIPADECAGASQAGAVNYIDRQLARHYQMHQDTYREGLDAVDGNSRRRFGSTFADATPDQQYQSTLAIEKDHRAFFDLVRQHTMEGYYGSPRHGGNRDAASWRMLGLDEPPLRGRAHYDLRKGSAT